MCRSIQCWRIDSASGNRSRPIATRRTSSSPSIRSKGTLPVYTSSFVADYLRPAAIKAGVKIEAGQRFGLHNLRHSLSNWLVNKAKDPAEDRARHPASLKNPDHSGSVYAERHR